MNTSCLDVMLWAGCFERGMEPASDVTVWRDAGTRASASIRWLTAVFRSLCQGGVGQISEFSRGFVAKWFCVIVSCVKTPAASGTVNM